MIALASGVAQTLKVKASMLKLDDNSGETSKLQFSIRDIFVLTGIVGLALTSVIYTSPLTPLFILLLGYLVVKGFGRVVGPKKWRWYELFDGACTAITWFVPLFLILSYFLKKATGLELSIEFVVVVAILTGAIVGIRYRSFFSQFPRLLPAILCAVWCYN